MNLVRSTAIVTHTGILYKGEYYSCQVAIRRRWFELAWAFGEWNIEIMCKPNQPDLILFIDEETGEQQVCNRVVKESANHEKLEKYFQSIERLKVRYRIGRNDTV